MENPLKSLFGVTIQATRTGGGGRGGGNFNGKGGSHYVILLY